MAMHDSGTLLDETVEYTCEWNQTYSFNKELSNTVQCECEFTIFPFLVPNRCLENTFYFADTHCLEPPVPDPIYTLRVSSGWNGFSVKIGNVSFYTFLVFPPQYFCIILSFSQDCALQVQVQHEV